MTTERELPGADKEPAAEHPPVPTAPAREDPAAATGTMPSEQFGSIASLSAPIVSVGGSEGSFDTAAPDEQQQAASHAAAPEHHEAPPLRGSEPPAASARRPPPKPKAGNSVAPGAGAGQPDGRIYFPPPSVAPPSPPLRTPVSSSSQVPSMGSMRSAPPARSSTASSLPAASAPAADGTEGEYRSGAERMREERSGTEPPAEERPEASQQVQSGQTAPLAPKVPSFPVPRHSSNPPPTLPSGTSPSRYPWMSSATAALADGRLPGTMSSRPMGSVPDASNPTDELDSATSGEASAEGSEANTESRSPSSAPRAAVLPRATREPARRSSTPPPKPRLVPPRPQKETPTVAIEAMRIIAIGVEEQAAAKPILDRGSGEIPAARPVSSPDLMSRSANADGSVRPRGDTLPAAGMGHSEPPTASPGAVYATSPTGSDLASRSEPATPEIAPAAELSDALFLDVDEAAASAKRRPPPPRRQSLPAPPYEADVGATAKMPSNVDIVLPDLVASEDVKAVADAGVATKSDDDDGEEVDSVETVEPVVEAPVPVVVVPQITAPQAAPRPPSRIPKSPGADAPPAQVSQIPQVPPRRSRLESSGDKLSAPGTSDGGTAPATAGTAPPSAASESSTASSTTNEKPKVRARRPWWEELFNEDFSRALARLSEHQIEQEVTFIEESLGVAPGAVVLDLGCGSGDHAVELASRGYGIVGYDLSLHQLALAQEAAQERGQKLNFMQGDMREMAFEEVFDAVFCWNTSFGYFEEDKNLAVAQRMFDALKPGGTLLLDVINRDFAAMDQPSSVWYEGDSCVCMDDMSIDFLTSRMRVKRSLILDDGRTRECTYSVRLYSLHELGKMLHDVGFRVTEASGHPSTPGVFLGQNSPRIIILAQKP